MATNSPISVSSRRVAGLLCAVLLSLAGLAARAEPDSAAIARLAGELAAGEARNGPSSPLLLPVIGQLAQAQRVAGALGEAAALRRRALSIAIGAFGCDSVPAAETMTRLGLAEIDRRRYLDAEPLLIIAERLLRPRKAPELSAALSGLARIALSRGDTAAAQAWASRAVDVARQRPQRRTAEPLRTMGAVLIAEGRYGEAEPILQEALARDRAQYGAESSETARSLSQLAQLYLRKGRPAEALQPAEQTLVIDRQVLGPAHPVIGDDWHDLGLIYEALNRAELARKAFASALAVFERGAGRETPRVAYAELELSRLARQQGDEAAATRYFRDARRLLNRAEAEERRRERKV